MSASGDLVYLCRRCKQPHHAWYVDDVAPALARAVQVEPHPLVPTMICTHECSPGRFGVCDLVGADLVGAGEDEEGA